MHDGALFELCARLSADDKKALVAVLLANAAWPGLLLVFAEAAMEAAPSIKDSLPPGVMDGDSGTNG